MNNPYIKASRSKIHNMGLYAAKDIEQDTRIIEYTGVFISDEEIERREHNGTLECVYLFDLGDGRTLDGDTDDNIAKYINHSCEPNCYSEIEDGHVYILAERDIKKGEELSYDYGFMRQGWSDHPCRCGSKNCFGFIVAKKHHCAIAKTKKYQRYLLK